HAFGLRTGAPGRVAVAGNRAQGRQRAPATPEMLRTRVKTDASGGRDQLDLMPLPQQIGKHRSSQYDCPLEVGVAFAAPWRELAIVQHDAGAAALFLFVLLDHELTATRRDLPMDVAG